MPAPPVSEITVHVGDIFDAAQQAQLRSAFGLGPDADLAPVLGRLAVASLSEYRDALLGEGMFTRAEDFQQKRLLMIILHVFQGLPNERQIASLLKLSLTRARALFNGVNVRYGDRLRQKIDTQKLQALKGASPLRDDFKVLYIRSHAVRQAIDDEIDELNLENDGPPYCTRLARVAGVNDAYEVNDYTFGKLKQKLKF